MVSVAVPFFCVCVSQIVGMGCDRPHVGSESMVRGNDPAGAVVLHFSKKGRANQGIGWPVELF